MDTYFLGRGPNDRWLASPHSRRYHRPSFTQQPLMSQPLEDLQACLRMTAGSGGSRITASDMQSHIAGVFSDGEDACKDRNNTPD
jgi:hypothetical protein